MAERGRRPLRGDEGELFERYHTRLLRLTALEVRASRDNIEEACAFAWAQLLSHDVRRDTVLPWLKQVARREAMRLDQLDRGTVPMGHEPGTVDQERIAEARANTEATPERWRAALARLHDLPERDRRIVAMRAFGWQYSEIGEELGISVTRVNQILSRADTHLYELEQRDRPPRSARVARLREVEADPPRYLRDAIGRPPRVDRRSAREGLRREWRRLALAIEDYRAAFGVTDPRRALGGHPRERDQRARRDELRDRIGRYAVEFDRTRR